MVFDRYHEGGGEMLLALALSDHAHDDGTNIYPSVKRLADKTRQSERTIQYQLRKMEECGWLVLVADEKGGRSKTREYRINEEWIKGAEIAPIKKGAIHDIKGAITVAPESSITINNRKEQSLKENIKEKTDSIRINLSEVTDQTFKDFSKLRNAKKAPLTLRAIENIRSEALKAGISLETALIECCARGWVGFKADWYIKTQIQTARASPPDRDEFNKRQTEIAKQKLFGISSKNEKDITHEARAL